MTRIARTLWMMLVLAVAMPLAAATQDSIPQDTIPQDSIPQDSTFLTLVTSVKSGDRVVFERNGAVLDEQSPKSGALLTTTSFVTTNLTGGESYVWTILKGTGGMYIGSRNGFYINNASNNNFTLDYDALITPWTFEFAEDSTATIWSSANHFFGETASYSGMYKAYSKLYLSAYGHDFRIYRLDRRQPDEPEPTAIDHPTTNGPKPTTKTIENGMVIIHHNGKRFNILGQTIR